MLFGDYLLGLIVFFVANVFRHLQTRIHKWESWPIVQGRICSTSPEPSRSMLGAAWEVEFSYFYSVEGQECSGWFRCDLWEERLARTLLEVYARNAPVPVRYNPAKHDVSVVLLKDLRLIPQATSSQ